MRGFQAGSGPELPHSADDHAVHRKVRARVEHGFGLVSVSGLYHYSGASSGSKSGSRSSNSSRR